MNSNRCFLVSLSIVTFLGCSSSDGDLNQLADESTAAQSRPVSENRAVNVGQETELNEDSNQPNTSLDSAQTTTDSRSPSAGNLFERRILPILQSNESSSCTECHFGGVDLKNYIHADEATTFATLRSQGLIDTEDPDKSKILEFISRRTDSTTPNIEAIRKVEIDAFRSWIREAVENPDLLLTTDIDETIGIELPVEVIQHLRRDRIMNSFVENIWSEMGRCINCHSPERNNRQVREHGSQMSWIVPHDPAATLELLVDSGNVDIQEPDQSMLLLKPLNLEDHGGGPKFTQGSRSDKNFRAFLNDYAAVVGGSYESADQLPTPSAEVSVMTNQHLRIIDLPSEFHDKLLRADVYGWQNAGWSDSRIAIAENPIVGDRQLFQSQLFAIAPRDSQRANELEPDQSIAGERFLIKIYVDLSDQTKTNRDYELGEEDFYGQVEVTREWTPGYDPPLIIHAPAQRSPE